MTTFLQKPWALKALYASNALWFTSAFIHFSFRGPFMMRKLSHRRTSPDPAIRDSPSGDAWHHDIMRYLGGMNTSLALLAYLRLFSPTGNASGSSALLSMGSPEADLRLDVLALTVLGLANASQAFCNFTFGRSSGRWIVGHGWDRITVLDAAFTVLDWAAAAARAAAVV